MNFSYFLNWDNSTLEAENLGSEIPGNLVSENNDMHQSSYNLILNHSVSCLGNLCKRWFGTLTNISLL